MFWNIFKVRMVFNLVKRNCLMRLKKHITIWVEGTNYKLTVLVLAEHTKNLRKIWIKQSIQVIREISRRVQAFRWAAHDLVFPSKRSSSIMPTSVFFRLISSAGGKLSMQIVNSLLVTFHDDIFPPSSCPGHQPRSGMLLLHLSFYLRNNIRYIHWRLSPNTGHWTGRCVTCSVTSFVDFSQL